jgi:hypothetical protein
MKSGVFILFFLSLFPNLTAINLFHDIFAISSPNVNFIHESSLGSPPGSPGEDMSRRMMTSWARLVNSLFQHTCKEVQILEGGIIQET